MNLSALAVGQYQFTVKSNEAWTRSDLKCALWNAKFYFFAHTSSLFEQKVGTSKEIYKHYADGTVVCVWRGQVHYTSVSWASVIFYDLLWLKRRWTFNLYTPSFLDRIAEGLHLCWLFEVINSNSFEQLCSSSGFVNLTCNSWKL